MTKSEIAQAFSGGQFESVTTIFKNLNVIEDDHCVAINGTAEKMKNNGSAILNNEKEVMKYFELNPNGTLFC